MFLRDLFAFIFRDLTPCIFSGLISFINSKGLVLSGLGAHINDISPVLSVKGLGRWLLCGLWGKLEGGKVCGLKCLEVLGLGRNTDASCTDPYAQAKRTNQVDGHTGPVG